MDTIESLRQRIRETEKELVRLKENLKHAEVAVQERGDNGVAVDQPADDAPWKWPLPAEDYERYARQLIISQVGVPGWSLATGDIGKFLTRH